MEKKENPTTKVKGIPTAIPITKVKAVKKANHPKKVMNPIMILIKKVNPMNREKMMENPTAIPIPIPIMKAKAVMVKNPPMMENLFFPMKGKK